MTFDVILARLALLNTPDGQNVDLRRFQDTLSMVMDDSDPDGYCFLHLFVRECDVDLLAICESLHDGMGVSKHLHKWIGRCAQLGFTGLERGGRQLQLQAKAGADCEILRESAEKLAGELEHVRMALQYMIIY
jgi:hypothetical protein